MALEPTSIENYREQERARGVTGAASGAELRFEEAHGDDERRQQGPLDLAQEGRRKQEERDRAAEISGGEALTPEARREYGLEMEVNGQKFSDVDEIQKHFEEARETQRIQAIKNASERRAEAMAKEEAARTEQEKETLREIKESADQAQEISPTQKTEGLRHRSRARFAGITNPDHLDAIEKVAAGVGVTEDDLLALQKSGYKIKKSSFHDGELPSMGELNSLKQEADRKVSAMGLTSPDAALKAYQDIAKENPMYASALAQHGQIKTSEGRANLDTEYTANHDAYVNDLMVYSGLSREDAEGLYESGRLAPKNLKLYEDFKKRGGGVSLQGNSLKRVPRKTPSASAAQAASNNAAIPIRKNQTDWKNKDQLDRIGVANSWGEEDKTFWSNVDADVSEEAKGAEGAVVTVTVQGQSIRDKVEADVVDQAMGGKYGTVAEMTARAIDSAIERGDISRTSDKESLKKQLIGYARRALLSARDEIGGRAAEVENDIKRESDSKLVTHMTGVGERFTGQGKAPGWTKGVLKYDSHREIEASVANYLAESMDHIIPGGDKKVRDILAEDDESKLSDVEKFLKTMYGSIVDIARQDTARVAGDAHKVNSRRITEATSGLSPLILERFIGAKNVASLTPLQAQQLQSRIETHVVMEGKDARVFPNAGVAETYRNLDPDDRDNMRKMLGVTGGIVGGDGETPAGMNANAKIFSAVMSAPTGQEGGALVQAGFANSDSASTMTAAADAMHQKFTKKSASDNVPTLEEVIKKGWFDSETVPAVYTKHLVPGTPAAAAFAMYQASDGDPRYLHLAMGMAYKSIATNALRSMGIYADGKIVPTGEGSIAKTINGLLSATGPLLQDIHAGPSSWLGDGGRAEKNLNSMFNINERLKGGTGSRADLDELMKNMTLVVPDLKTVKDSRFIDTAISRSRGVPVASSQRKFHNATIRSNVIDAGDRISKMNGHIKDLEASGQHELARELSVYNYQAYRLYVIAARKTGLKTMPNNVVSDTLRWVGWAAGVGPVEDLF